MKAILILIMMVVLHMIVEHVVTDIVKKTGGQPIQINYQIFTDALTELAKHAGKEGG